MKTSNWVLLAFCLSAISLPSVSQTMSAMQAYDIVSEARSKAGALWGKDSASITDIDAGIKILYGGLHFLDSMPVREMADGNNALKDRRLNLYIDLAMAYATNKQSDSAIGYLEKIYTIGASWSYIKDSPKFKYLYSDPRFIAVADKLKKQGDLYKGTAFKSLYRPVLTEEQKIAGLTLLWSQAKYNFVYFDHTDVDWNKAYLEYLVKIKEAKTTTEYYKVLRAFYALLKDGHSGVFPPRDIQSDFYTAPPMATELIEGRAFVIEVTSDSLKKEGIVPGLEVLTIDSEPVIAYADKYVKPYESSSTPQDMAIREFSYALLCGPEKQPVTMELKDGNGRIFSKTIARSGYHDVMGLKFPIEYKVIGNIGYLTINSFNSGIVNKQFESLFDSISQTNGLIIDIRNNGGGSSSIGYKILKTLTDKPFETSASKRLEYISRPGEEVNWSVMGRDDWEPDGKRYYSKPVVLLVSARTFSAAEDFTVAFDYMKRGKIVGQPTGGSTGQPVTFELPGGGTARVCGKRDTYPDGKEFVGIGIMPDVAVTPTIRDLRDGRDAAKEKALEILNGK